MIRYFLILSVLALIGCGDRNYYTEAQKPVAKKTSTEVEAVEEVPALILESITFTSKPVEMPKLLSYIKVKTVGDATPETECRIDFRNVGDVVPVIPMTAKVISDSIKLNKESVGKRNYYYRYEAKLADTFLEKLTCDVQVSDKSKVIEVVKAFFTDAVKTEAIDTDFHSYGN